MPSNPPLMASGSRELKRPRPIPKAVRTAIGLMVYGALDDPDCKPLGFIEAAKLAEIAPDHMRRYLDRAEVRALLRSERRVFRDAICAGNEGALKRIRDTSANGMSVVASVRALEQIDVEAATRPSGNTSSPGIVIRIITPAAAPSPQIRASSARRGCRSLNTNRFLSATLRRRTTNRRIIASKHRLCVTGRALSD